MLRLTLSIVIARFLSFHAVSQPAEWVSTHGPAGDRISCIAEHSAGILFLGTTSNGVFSSTDDGLTWASAGGPSSAISGMNIRADGEIFACGFGVFRSTDLGETWTDLGPADGLACIVSDRNGHLYAGAWSSVYRSTDDGATWVQLVNDLPIAWISDLLVDNTGNLIAGTTFGILRSMNQGENWTFIGPTPAPAAISLEGLAINNNGWMCAAVSGEGMYYSTDAGASWTLSSNGIGDLFLTAATIDSLNRILAGTMSGHVYYLPAHGSDWIRLNGEFWFSRVETFMLSEGELLVGTELAGVFHTNDHGAPWTQRNAGLPLAPVYSLAADPAGDLYARTRTLIYRTTDHGMIWMPVFFGDDAEGTIAVSPGGSLFAATSFLPAARSTDHGETWVSLYNGLSGYVTDFGFLPSGEVFASGGGFFRSTNNGDEWTKSSQPSGLSSFDIDSGERFFGATQFGEILRSDDQGLTWDTVALLGPRTLYAMTIDEEDAVFVGSFDVGGLYRSTDRGITWTSISAGLGDSLVHSLETFNGRLYAGTVTQQVFLSTDQGETWTDFGAGLPDSVVTSLVMDSDGYLHAGTARGGVYRTPEIVSTVTTSFEPERFALDQNYPNPFNPRTEIGYQIPETANVRLAVFDILGREVEILVDKTQNAGRYVVSFDAGAVASGVYFYRISVAGRVSGRKMIVLK